MPKLYLKGCIPSTELHDAVLEPGDEVWTLNYQGDRTPEKAPTRHFSLHGLREEYRCHGLKYLRILSNMACPVYLWGGQIEGNAWGNVCAEAGDPGLPFPKNARRFPLDSIENWLDPPRRYFTGSFAYMLAFALAIGEFEEVRIVGTEFGDDDLIKSRLAAARFIEDGVWTDGDRNRYEQIINDLRGQDSGDESWARECIMYWIGRLEGAGTRVTVNPQSWLFYNKWLDTHAKDCPHDEIRGLYGLDPCIGG